MKQIEFIIEQDLKDGGFIAESFVNENEHIITQADTEENLIEQIHSALECHFENPDDVPRIITLKYKTE